MQIRAQGELSFSKSLPLFVAQEGPPYQDAASAQSVPPVSSANGGGLPTMATRSPSTSPTWPSSSTEGSRSRLPFGWTTQVAPNGRNFYINHRLRRTTWEYPTDSDAVYSIVEDDIGLPLGWEKRTTRGGQPFFLDHNAGITTWEDPREGRSDSPLAPLHRKMVYLTSHLRGGITTVKDDLWVGQDTLFEDSVEALFNASNELLKGEVGIMLLDETRIPLQDWLDVLFYELFSAEKNLFQPSKSKLSRMDINVNYLGHDSLNLYSFAGRLHAVAILQRKPFDLAFLASIHSALSDYDTRGMSDRAVSYRSGVSDTELDDSVLLIEQARSLRMEAFMDAFVELVPPHLLQAFTLPELYVVLAAGRSWTKLEDARAGLGHHCGREQEFDVSIPSHTNEQLLDEIMLKLTGLRLESY